MVGCVFTSGAHGSPPADNDPLRDFVGVAIVNQGRAIVLATPGLASGGRTWRFRSLDTMDLPQPVRRVALSASGTKLFIQAGAGRGAVLDLTRQSRHHAPLQYVSVDDLAIDGRVPAGSHRLPNQRFASVDDGATFVLDDTARVTGEAVATLDHACDGDPSATTALARTESSLLRCLERLGRSVGGAQIARALRALVEESAMTWAADGARLDEWRFFPVAVDAELYAPVLELSVLETVFPTAFETLEQLSAGVTPRRNRSYVDVLYDRHLRVGKAGLRARCNYYVTTHSVAGSWIVEYWLYYPFDVGGLGSHPHDPEHIFVEVDKLGGTVRRVIGAGHGYMAGNNVYTAGRGGAQPVRLPLFAIAELGKHASAPDIDRDGVFTPGIDENEYNERAKVWGVRDVIGTINNEFISYDTAMSGRRRATEYLALAAAVKRFPDEPDLVPAASCGLTALPAVPSHDNRPRLSDWILLPPCHDLTTDCARRHVTSHPDFLDLRTILKEWSFPSSFLRATYGLGPRRGLHSVGLGYVMDMDRVPGVKNVLPLPGRLGADIFYWHQPASTPSSEQATKPDDRDSCPRKMLVDGEAFCPVAEGFGWGLRYEQFLSNLFGIYSAVRLLSPPVGDAWITFGPFVEAPLGRRSNVMIQGGLAFRPYESPRFELKVSVGLWKPKTNHIGIRAGSDHPR
jgi:hypothetical protein